MKISSLSKATLLAFIAHVLRGHDWLLISPLWGACIQECTFCVPAITSKNLAGSSRHLVSPLSFLNDAHLSKTTLPSILTSKTPKSTMPSKLSLAVAVVAVLIAGYIYMCVLQTPPVPNPTNNPNSVGIPPALKRKLEDKALETMGENKASYMMKDAIGKVPEADQKELGEIKEGVGNLGGAALQNPLGKLVS